MMINKIKRFVYLSCLFSSLLISLHSTNTSNSLGSNTVYALSSQENYTSPEVVWGMVDYQEGFSVNSTVTLGLGLTAPIRSGDLDFADGSSLYLWTDLHIGSGVNINIDGVSGGTLYLRGDNNVIYFDKTLTMSSNNKIKILENTVLDFQGNDLTFEDDAQIIVDGEATLLIKDAHIKNVKGLVSGGGSLAMTSTLSWIILEDVVLNLGGTYTLDQGYMLIRDNVIVRGEDKTFSFSSKFDSYYDKSFLIIDENSKLKFDLGTIFRYQNYSTSVTDSMAESFYDQALIVMSDESSKLHFNGCIFEVPINKDKMLGGCILSNGTVIFENRVILDSLHEDGSLPDFNYWSDRGIIYYYPSIIWGFYPYFNDINVEILAGAKLELYGNLLVGNNG